MLCTCLLPEDSSAGVMPAYALHGAECLIVDGCSDRRSEARTEETLEDQGLGGKSRCLQRQPPGWRNQPKVPTRARVRGVKGTPEHDQL